VEERTINCRKVGVYDHVLIKGKSYTIRNENEKMYKVVGEHGKTIGVDKTYFTKDSVIMLDSWTFDDEIEDFDLVEATLIFSNGSKRWCLVTTPQKLVVHFDSENLDPPGMNIRHLIIVKSLARGDVEKTLKYLDSQDELEGASLRLESDLESGNSREVST